MVIATQWITLFFVPIVPLRRMKCRYVGESELNPHWEPGRRFEEVERLELSLSSVLATYVAAVATLLASVSPLAIVVSQLRNPPVGMVWLALGVASAVWPVAIVFWIECCQKSFLEGTWEPQRTKDADVARIVNEAIRRQKWRANHCFSETVYICAMVVGLVPGVAIGRWFEWGLQLLEVAGLVTGALALGLVAVLDRFLIRSRGGSP